MVGTRSITDIYMSVLTSLSDDDKLDLISKLSASMRNEKATKRVRPDLRTCFCGDWTGMVAENLRDNEYRGRSVEEW